MIHSLSEALKEALELGVARTCKDPRRMTNRNRKVIEEARCNGTYTKGTGFRGTGLLGSPRSFCIRPKNKCTTLNNIHKRIAAKVLTLSLAVTKSAFVTRMRRSRNARRPASVQTALISAPDRSSLAITNSSRSTSSLRFIREVCNLRKSKPF